MDIPGYAPLRNDPGMIELTVEAAANALPHRKFDFAKNMGTGSTDMGDLSTIMPVIHPYAGGAKGTAHGSDYQIADPEQACVESAMLQLAMLHLLLSDGAARAKKILSDFKPQFEGKEAYLAFIDSLASHGDRIDYRDDGTATVRID